MKFSKYTIALITLATISIVIGTLLFLFVTGLIFPLTSMVTSSYCASLGIERLTIRDLGIIQNSTGIQIQFLEITDNDLSQIPKLREAIDKVANKVEFNRYGYDKMTVMEAQIYYKFLSDKSEQQYNIKLTEPYLFIEYNGKTYSVSNFAFSDAQELELNIELQPNSVRNSIHITEQDLESLPKIRNMINQIGTYEASPSAYVGLPEDEQNRIQKWFEQKYEQLYNAVGSSSYFHYNGKNYSVSFAIC